VEPNIQLPEVRLVDKISYGSHPIGRFINTSNPQRIEFSQTECSKIASHEPLQFIVCHELGHWFRTNYVELEDIVGWNPGEGFLIFGATNSEEGFADAFAAFLMGDSDLETRYPEQQALLADLLADFEGELHEFCDRTCEWLAKQLDRKPK
jgi:hypothetical protein